MPEIVIIVCDRCGERARQSYSLVVPHVHSQMDGTIFLCDKCWNVLKSWLSKDNATVQGDANRPEFLRGPGWREVCLHRIPCAGSCPNPRYERTTDGP